MDDIVPGKDEPIGTQEPRDGPEYLYRLVKDLSYRNSFSL